MPIKRELTFEEEDGRMFIYTYEVNWPSRPEYPSRTFLSEKAASRHGLNRHPDFTWMIIRHKVYA